MSQWADLSGNGYHLTQATAADQPLYTSLNSAFNNLATVDFDGIDHTMASAAFTSELSGPFTTVIVAALNSGEHIFDTSNGTRNSFGKGGGRWEMYSGASLKGSVADTNTNIFSILSNNSSSELKLNGGSDATGNPGTTTLNGVRLAELSGGGFLGNVDIAEVIVIDRRSEEHTSELQSH